MEGAIAGLVGLRLVLAGNPSPLTMDGTRVYIVGRRYAAVVDPGPDDDEHVGTLAAVLGDAEIVQVLLTHTHSDHAGAAASLASRTGAAVRCLADGTLQPGEHVRTDAGELVAVHTPGHTPDHAAFHWPERRAVFCGDLMLGGLDTALVAPPEGDLGDYLASLERLRALAPGVLLPTHGPPFQDPATALDRYLAHRRERERQVLAALDAGSARAEEVAARVYGDELEGGLRAAAEAAVVAYLEHLARGARVRREPDGRWSAAAGGDPQNRMT